MTSVRSTLVVAAAVVVTAMVTVEAVDAQRGRGRRGVEVMTLSVPAWPDGGMIPEAHAQDGGERSPALSWSGAPDGTASYVLVVHDMDAPAADGDRLHWLVWNIPPTVVGLPEGLTQGPQLDDGIRQISVSGAYYRGPAKVEGEPPHHYLFELYAVDAMLNVRPTGTSPAETRAAVMGAVEAGLLGRATYVGRY